MKRLLIAALAAAMFVGFAVTASAVELRVTGTWDFNFGWTDNPTAFESNESNKAMGARYGRAGNGQMVPGRGTEDHFMARQRVRTQIDFIASENVQGVLFFEIGDMVWGGGGGSYAGLAAGGGTGGALGTDGVNIKTRRAYIDFNIPNTELVFRVGLQGLALPAVVAGSPILGWSGTDVAAILASYKINDMITVAAFWARPYDLNAPLDARNAGQNDEMDLFGILVPVTISGIGNFTPYGMYGIIGTDVVNRTAFSHPGLYTNALGTRIATAQNALLNNDYMYAWWLGLAVDITALDPLILGADVAWGTLIDGDRYMSRSGWYLAGKIGYKTPWVTPTLVGWWASGDDGNIYNGSERLPTIDAGFNGTSFLGAGTMTLGAGTWHGTISRQGGFDASVAGTWGLALQLNNISFVQDLTHQIIVAYIGGTNAPRSMRDTRAFDVPWSPYYNNPSNIWLTTRDHAWEVDFNTKYQMYENLAVFCEMGMFDIQRVRSPWRQPENRSTDPSFNRNIARLYNNSTAWKLVFGLQYTF